MRDRVERVARGRVEPVASGNAGPVASGNAGPVASGDAGPVARGLIGRIEALLHQDTGRGAAALFAAARGGLCRAAQELAAAPPKHVGIVTGFYVPRGTPPAAETDGPAGAALLALAFARIGAGCRLLTDRACRSACQAALAGAGLPDVPVDAPRPDAPAAGLIAAWRAEGVDLALAIERCGLAADGRPRNMRGEDVGAHAASLDAVFTAGPWRTMAIGDGGNEVGMGALPPGLIAASVPFGAAIACVTPASNLIVAGVSHWGAYGLIAALAVLRADWRAGLLACLDPVLERNVMEMLVERGPAVDGVTLGRTLTIDGFDLAAHGAVRDEIRAIVEKAVLF